MRTTEACVEALENRRMMDGKVSVVLSGGDLIVSGDSADNVVRITRPAAGMLRVAGRDDTTVNAAAHKDFAAATFDDLKIRMRQGGEDDVSIQGPITFPG